MSEKLSNYGFSDFCLDKAICGHCFVKPAIWTFETYGRVFAPLAKDSNPVVEVIIRVISFVIASIALIFALPLGAFGLLIKASSFCCCDPDRGSPLVQPEEEHPDLQVQESLEEPAKPQEETTTQITQPEFQFPPEPPSQLELSSSPVEELTVPAKTLSPGDQKLAEEATHLIKEARDMLTAIRWNEIDIEKVKKVKIFFKKNHFVLGQVLSSLPTTKQKDPTVLEKLAEEYLFLTLWRQSLKRAHLFQISHPGHKEGVIKNNGDCLFETFLKLQETCNVKSDNFTNWSVETLKKWSEQENRHIIAYMPPSTEPVFIYNDKAKRIACFKKDANENFHSYHAQELRLDAAKWLEENFKNPNVLLRLIESIEHHLFAKLGKLEIEKEGLESLLPGLEDDVSISQTQTRLEEIPKEIELITAKQIPAIYEARGTGKQEINHLPIETLIWEYLDEIKKPTIFAGSAELFALSYKHNVCIKVFQDEDKIPVFTFNEKANPTLNFRLKGSHYNPEFPDEKTDDKNNIKDGKKES